MNTSRSPRVTNSDFHIASPLPGMGAEVGAYLPRAVYDGPGSRRDRVRVVGRVGVDHHDLVEQLGGLHQRRAHPGHDVADRRRLVAGRHHQVVLRPVSCLRFSSASRSQSCHRCVRLHLANLDASPSGTVRGPPPSNP